MYLKSNHFRPTLLGCSLLLAGASAAFGQTTTLDFAAATTSTLNTGYGDYVDGPMSGGISYTGTGTFTPHVAAAFGAESLGNGSGLFKWGTGYNDLVDVVYGAINGGGPGSTGQAELLVTLSADPGYLATIESFDLGNWGPAITAPYVRVVDEAGTVLFEELDVALNPNTSPDERNFVLSPAPSGKILTLRISVVGLGGFADNVGIDNLTFGEQPDSGAFGFTTYCEGTAAQGANPNGTGHRGILRAFGSSSIAANDLSLTATGLPLTSFGFFITSQTQGFFAQPGGSAGNLCVAGAIGRYVGPGQIQNTQGTGAIALDLDLAQMPTPTGLISAQVGESWNFQAWHRDQQAGVATSNFTEAISLTFVP